MAAQRCEEAVRLLEPMCGLIPSDRVVDLLERLIYVPVVRDPAPGDAGLHRGHRWNRIGRVLRQHSLWIGCRERRVADLSAQGDSIVVRRPLFDLVSLFRSNRSDAGLPPAYALRI